MMIIGRFLLGILMQVLIKLVLTMFSKEMVGKLMFACLHRIVKLTKTTVDDEYVDKLESMYWGINDTTDQQAYDLLRKIKKDE